MKIKALIELRTPPYPKGLPILHAENNIYQAYDRFIKSKSFNFLPVLQNGNYYGIVTFYAVAHALIKDYKNEKSKRFRTNRLLVMKIKKSIQLLSKGTDTDQTCKIIKLQMEMLAML